MSQPKKEGANTNKYFMGKFKELSIEETTEIEGNSCVICYAEPKTFIVSQKSFNKFMTGTSLMRAFTELTLKERMQLFGICGECWEKNMKLIDKLY
jgi:hypothetical protein